VVRGKRPAPSRREASKAGVLEAYGELCLWRAKHVPWLLRPDGVQLFFRLVQQKPEQAIHTSDLYADAGASPPVVHRTLMELRRAKLVTLDIDQDDARRTLVQPTTRLHDLASAYVHAMMLFLA
jgi:DNA-binding MarR family transcriptional regulator